MSNLFYMQVASPSFAEVKSATRVRNFGEVFTPLRFVSQMLEMLPASDFSNPAVRFVEPTCGDGAFVCQVLERIVVCCLQTGGRRKSKAQVYEAIASSISRLWAVDIQEDNVDECRANVLMVILRHLGEPADKHTRFLAWAIEALVHHIRKGSGLELEGIRNWMPFALSDGDVVDAAVARAERELLALFRGRPVPFTHNFLSKVFRPNGPELAEKEAA